MIITKLNPMMEMNLQYTFSVWTVIVYFDRTCTRYTLKDQEIAHGHNCLPVC